MLPLFSFGHFLEDLEFPWAINESSSSAFTFVFPALKKRTIMKKWVVYKAVFLMRLSAQEEKNNTLFNIKSRKVDIFKCQKTN